MECLKFTQTDVLRLGKNPKENTFTLHWFWDASFAVHPNHRSHTGGTLSTGLGALLSSSQKQKLNSRSSTEAELIVVDDGMSPMLWSKLFLEAQGIQVQDNVLYQDNKSAILLEKNGKSSSSKRTRHLNIRYFFIMDQVNQGNLRIQYCPTAFMLADYNTKPITGAKFQEFRSQIMGHTPVKFINESTEQEAMDHTNESTEQEAMDHQLNPSCDSTPDTNSTPFLKCASTSAVL